MKRVLLVSCLALAAALRCTAALAEEAFKPFEFSFPVYMKRGALPEPGPRLQVMFPSDFEMIDYRTGNGGPFFGRREEIEALRRAAAETPKLVKGVFQIRDPVPAHVAGRRVFDRTRNLFEAETQPPGQESGLFKVEEMRRADTRSVPILLVKGKLGPASVYSASLFLPDDTYVSIAYWMPMPPTKLNEEIWQRFASSIRER